MLDAYYCTAAGVVQGTSHLSRPVHGSIAGMQRCVIVEGRESTVHGVSRAHFPVPRD
jgi:hypothetical protein